MQIHELPDVTAIGSGGYFATDNGSQTTKIDYDALAKAIIEQYSASTLAGSAQSVKAALDGLMQKSLPTEIAPRTTIASGDDLNAYTSPGIYRCATASIAASLSNCPISNVGFNLDVAQLYNVAFAYQRITASTGATSSAVVEVYERFINVRDSMYGTWKKVPTRAEVDALSSNMASITFTRMIATTSGTTATLPSNYRGILKTVDSSADRCGLYIVRTASNGNVNCTPVREATALTIDSSIANKLMVTSPGSSVCIFENISGTATV